MVAVLFSSPFLVRYIIILVIRIGMYRKPLDVTLYDISKYTLVETAVQDRPMSLEGSGRLRLQRIPDSAFAIVVPLCSSATALKPITYSGMGHVAPMS
jgi:hypothetical protein